MATDQHDTTTRHATASGSIPVAIFWMALLSVLLGWLPALGPLIAGYVGGKKAGGVARAIVAAVLPAVLIGAAVFFTVNGAFGLPVVGAILGGLSATILAIHTGAVLVGALIGGTLA